MIPEVRVGMNKRFIEVFNLLVEKGIIVMNDRGGKGIGDFANDILGKPYSHIIRAFLSDSDKRCIDYHHVDKLCALYGVSKTYILEGKGNPLEDKRVRPSANVSNLSPLTTGHSQVTLLNGIVSGRKIKIIFIFPDWTQENYLPFQSKETVCFP